MEISTYQQMHRGVKTASSAKQLTYFPPLDQETRSRVETACAAYHMSRKEQTLRAWACLENGPLRPIRINGRLSWLVADIKRILSEGSAV